VDYYQTFPNVRLPLKAGAGSRHVVADLSFYDYGSQPNCTAALHSLWQGKVMLQGQEWQAGLLGAPAGEWVTFEGGNLLLRPWTERSRPFSVNSGSLEAFPFSRKLFFGNRAYQLQCTNEVQGDGVKVRMRFVEQELRLGELRVTGQFVRRITLEGGPYLVVIDQPEATVKVPVGRYKEAKVCLRRGEAAAHLDGPWEAAVGRITVAERNLMLLYRLTGAGGPYQMVNEDRSHPPEFTIYQGDKKVGSGKFEFG
jgi:hypothetical protein